MDNQEFTAFKKGMSVGIHSGVKHALSILQTTDSKEQAKTELTELAQYSIKIAKYGVENAGEAESDTAKA